MKKIMSMLLVLVLVFVFVSGLFAGLEETAILWNEYRAAKKSAFDSDSVDVKIAHYFIAAEKAEKLERPDIQAWQLNNAGFAIIKWFKGETNYAETMKKIEDMEAGADKIDFINLTKAAFKEAFKGIDNLTTIDKAIEYIEEGKSIAVSGLGNESLEDFHAEFAKIVTKADSNLSFISWIKEFAE